MPLVQEFPHGYPIRPSENALVDGSQKGAGAWPFDGRRGG